MYPFYLPSGCMGLPAPACALLCIGHTTLRRSKLPPISTAAAGTCSCTNSTALQSQVAHGLLWVYGDPSAEAWLTAFNKPPACGLAEMGVGADKELKGVR